MDVYANDVFISVFKQSGLVCRLARGNGILHSENCPIGRYTLLYDPIDGSSNTDINLSLFQFAIGNSKGMIQMDQPATCCKMA